MPVAALLSLDGLLDEAAALNMLAQLKSLPSEVEELGVVILRIRVGGGSLGAAQAVAEGLEVLREDVRVPTVAVVIETALSAGFFAAMACDRIVACPAATLGGCGAIIRRVSIDRLLEKVGVSYQPVSSGMHKDSFFPAGTLEQGQSEILDGLVAGHLEQFMEFVARRRSVDASVLDQISAGQVLSGARARDLSLIDANGGLFAAIDVAARLISASSISVRAISEHGHASAESAGAGQLFRSILGLLGG